MRLATMLAVLLYAASVAALGAVGAVFGRRAVLQRPARAESPCRMVGADNGERLLELRQERVRMMRTLTEAQGEAARAKAAASAERSAAAQRRASQRPSISQYGNTEADAAKASLESMFSLATSFNRALCWRRPRTDPVKHTQRVGDPPQYPG